MTNKNSSNETLVVLTPDDKELLLKATKDLFYAAQQLHEWVKGNNLTNEMKGILTSLIENHFVNISKITAYDSLLTKEHEQRHIDIRTANGRIRELEEMLADAKPIDGLKEQLRKLHDIVRDWWDEYGFRYVGEFDFTGSGNVKLEFGFMLDFSSIFSDTPDSDRKTKAQHVQDLRDQGFEIKDAKGDGLKVADTTNNRELLTKMLKLRFPSIKIISFHNHCANQGDYFTLRHIEAYIYDLKDIPIGG